MTGTNVDTLNMNHGTTGAPSTSSPAGEHGQGISGAYSPLNDAHYFGNVVFDMYRNWYNTAPLSFKLKMPGAQQPQLRNAFWDGSQMTFGDRATTFYPLVSLDGGPRGSHGFTEQNSGLVYSVSPVASTRPSPTWRGSGRILHEGQQRLAGGGQIFKGRHGSLRYFEDPARDGKSIGHASDYYDGIDVHHSSGSTTAPSTCWPTPAAGKPQGVPKCSCWPAASAGPQHHLRSGACGVTRAATDLGFPQRERRGSRLHRRRVSATCGGTRPKPGSVLQNRVPVSNLTAAKGQS